MTPRWSPSSRRTGPEKWIAVLLAFSAIPFLSSSAKLSSFEKPRAGFFEDVLEGAADQKYCKVGSAYTIMFTPSGLIEDTCCDYQTVEDVNHDLHVKLGQLVKEPYFRYHKVDLYRECPFWHEDGSCANRACGVDTLDDWKDGEQWNNSKSLAEITTVGDEVPTKLEDGCIYRESDFCVSEDDKNTEAVFVDLAENPERFTGYAGPSANKVWKSIYEENCFGVVPYLDPSRGKESGGTGFASLGGGGGGKSSLDTGLGSSQGGSGSSGLTEMKTLMGSLAAPRDGQEEMCLEKRVFYRLISGLHASISIHICDEYLDPLSNKWVPNLECFITRIGQHPERLQNVYFDYVLLLRALNKSAQYLASFDICSGDDEADRRTKEKLKSLARTASSCPSTFDEKSMFSGPGAQVLKEEFKSHFRNISRIMDCVGCDKCRLWGKLQVTGLGTALKLLFSYEDDPSNPDHPAKLNLQRSEVVAFINTLNRFSESLAAIEKFRSLWAERDRRPSASATRTSLPSSEGSHLSSASTKETGGLLSETPTRDEGAKKSPLSSPFPRGNKVPSSPLPLTREIGSRATNWFSKVIGICRSSFMTCLSYLEEVFTSFSAAGGGGRKEL